MSMIERLEALLAEGNDSSQLRYGLASACFSEQRFADAHRHAGIAVKLDPDYSAAWRLLGRASEKIGDMAAARDAYRNGIAVAESRGDKQLVREMTVFMNRLQRDAD
ncbi:MAG TPA: tetratricopeptide repeat protein [Gammaproteobacteria bacterium]|nr:tetratricopeptide repeat protein [Gammaproteobacteria bacterium]